MCEVLSAKIVLLGESGVGKTALLSRYVVDTFTPDVPQTVAASFQSKQICLDGQKIDLAIWDTAGQEVYRTLTPMYYRDAQMALIVYSVDDETSFKSLSEWVSQVKEMSPDVVISICGNKTDLPNRTVKFDEAMSLAESLNVSYVEASAMNGNGVDIAFESMISSYLNLVQTTQKKNLKRVGTLESVNVSQETQKNEKKKCCH
ncbi:Ras-related protein Rab-18A [Tritrichomonas foetus]|uniref:Ras-related protein Rab-18A n=1 Tax=Tritrichomonas foetus TaxID=1144522 RepID=A0A1J4L1H1_9EUKA|nr:Ras-related protein Rab-18A [Tritrichomonas foetus]|eukprot:OHT15806.1 Ras-related protein Rab-18A [Tritrichomonas foetus]